MSLFLGFTTNALTIRPFTKNDAIALYTLTKQPEITDSLPDWKMTERQIDGFLDSVITSYDAFDPEDVRIMLAIEHKKDKVLIGWCGVFPNELLDPTDREIAYAISKHYRNRGYATDAVVGMASYAFNQSRLKQVVAIVKPFNKPSSRVLDKAGFEHRLLVTLSDGSDYDYFVLQKEVHAISFLRIEPYMDLLAEVEHVQLDRKNPSHERWLRKRIRGYEERGAKFFAYHDPHDKERYGIVTVLHEEAPEGIDSLGARAEVLNIGVNRQARRSGVGSILLKIAEQYARRRGAYCLFLMTYAEDYDVIAFYGKNGYVPVATLPDVYGSNLEGNVFCVKSFGKPRQLQAMPSPLEHIMGAGRR